MRLRSISILTAAAAALILTPARTRANPFLSTVPAITLETERDPGSISHPGDGDRFLLSDLMPLSSALSPDASDFLGPSYLEGSRLGPSYPGPSHPGPSHFAPSGDPAEIDVNQPADSNYQGFLSPEFLSLTRGSFPLALYDTRGITNTVPEPSSLLFLTCGCLAIVLGIRQRAQPATR
jgi:hypothetical protein